MNKETYKITLIGCDDYTEFIMQLSREESALIYQLSSLSKEYSTYSCQPILEIKSTNTSKNLN